MVSYLTMQMRVTASGMKNLVAEDQGEGGRVK